HESFSYDKLWVESNWKTGNDPVLFGKKNNQTYLLARWGTDEVPLRTEEQVMISYQRQVENEALRDNGMFQVWFFMFEAICIVGGTAILTQVRSGYVGTAFLLIGLILEIGRRLHKNRGFTCPFNVWEQQALKFVKNQQVHCV
ncbi:MAG: hypothetical protein G01um101466_857, partial [Parcubacteria group bacterium Gr01-1014_66]